ncbi:hypothetical protein [Microvirga rosea]|uniref:hypothetical protein n=1 Tax=Microvirga rosea TaxID=2715425 RepID=UPI001D09F872|nr:hypothetical protein [Microvirga rosea]MCB8823260.1 hypothetical protein [Microvirga rosea]
MVKRIGSMAWRVEVGADGQLFSLGVRADTGREYEVLLGTVDSTPIVSDLLGEMARVHRALPPRVFAEGAGPHHPRSVPLQPLATRIEDHRGQPVLTLDFGGTVLKIQIDPASLQKDLAKYQGS